MQLREAWAAPAAYGGGGDGKTPEATLRALSRLQTEVFNRRLRVKDVFEDFDPLRSGRCTPSQFQRAVNRLSPKLCVEDGMALSDYFTEPGRQGPQVVNWKEFSAAIEEIFAPRGLEKDPTRKVPRPGSTVSDANATPQALPKWVQQGLAERRSVAQGAPASARVSRDSRNSPWSGSDLRQLSARGAGNLGGPEHQSDKQLIQRLKEMVKRRQLRVHGAFQDFDPLRRGLCSHTHLRTVLTVLNISLQQSELEALQRLYSIHGVDKNSFDYRSFCNDINELSLYRQQLDAAAWEDAMATQHPVKAGKPATARRSPSASSGFAAEAFLANDSVPAAPPSAGPAVTFRLPPRPRSVSSTESSSIAARRRLQTAAK